MRGGFTLIELIIVILILGFATVLMLDSYSASQNRLKFHLEASEIQSALDVARSSARNAAVETDKDRIVLINIGEDEAPDTVQSFIDMDSDSAFTAGTDIILKDIELNAEDIELGAYRVMTDEDGGIWDTVLTNPIVIRYSPPEAQCDFDHATSDEDLQEFMLELPLYKPGETEATRYIYLHKVACLTELLVNKIEL
jgi:prepilin-type N-terminal cleavage/methylation domain-containing protein